MEVKLFEDMIVEGMDHPYVGPMVSYLNPTHGNRVPTLGSAVGCGTP